MNKIQILPKHEAQKIAAGEVVERPANIVKELLENSLDAGSTTITLYCDQAGKKLIRVVDDGCGMSHTDAQICFLPHATSKIKTLDDLQTIASFGFRGEALASISAVSKVTVTTKQHDHQDDLGSVVTYYEGQVQKSEQAPCSVGTDLSVKELFYNVPARQKFLKRDDTEWNHIQHLFQSFCLSNLDVNFKLYRDGKLMYNAPAVKSVKDRVAQVWGYNLSQQLKELSATRDDISIQGFISHHTFWRYGRNDIFMFVNNRWIKDQNLSKALLKGYANVLPPGRFPAAYLFVTLPSDQVDINVHPKKEEVRFVRPGVVKNLLLEGVRKTLEQHISDKFVKSGESQEAVVSVQHDWKPQHFQKPLQKQAFAQPEVFPWNSIKPLVNKTNSVEPTQTIPVVAVKESQVEVVEQFEESYKIVGQIFDTYLILQRDNECIIVDQHAAHERILYEKFQQNFEQKAGTRLLFPQIINLPADQIKTVLQEQEFFAKQGIHIEQFGEQELAIKSSPPKIQQHCLKELILEVVAFIQEHDDLDPDVFRKKLNDHIHAQMACKAAVKAGDTLSDEHIKKLVSDLQKVKNRYICAHGRPTLWTIEKTEIEKRFKRC